MSIDVTDDAIRTYCSCPYDYAGDCKHVVAVLLAVNDRGVDADTDSITESSENLPDSVDVEALVEQATVDELRTFLLAVLEDDCELRDRFVAFAGEDAGKTVYDYKQEIGRLLEDAAGRGGMIDYDTHVDFSQYYDLAETHRERGHVDAATDIYRALVSTCAYLLEELDEEKALLGLYEETYLESSRFCKQYAQRLIEEGHEDRAIDVLEDGIDTFRSPADLRWLATDLYRTRNPEKYRETLKDSETLSWLRRYRDPVATVDPVESFCRGPVWHRVLRSW